MLGGLLDWLRGGSAKAKTPTCFFATGTGRCGSMLVARLLAKGTNVDCHHERSITTSVMKRAFYRSDPLMLKPELENNLFPNVEASRQQGKIYGECSAHLFMLFPDIYDRYGQDVRFIHLVRRPDTFAQSALARGFFNPSHPHPLEHIRPHETTAIGQRWGELTPLEKCMWYWNEVNSRVATSLEPLPADFWRLQRIEEFNLGRVEELYGFLGIAGYRHAEKGIKELTEVRVNASPGLGDDRSLNPWSQPWSLPDYPNWTGEQKRALNEFAGPLARSIYPDVAW